MKHKNLILFALLISFIALSCGNKTTVLGPTTGNGNGNSGSSGNNGTTMYWISFQVLNSNTGNPFTADVDLYKNGSATPEQGIAGHDAVFHSQTRFTQNDNARFVVKDVQNPSHIYFDSGGFNYFSHPEYFTTLTDAIGRIPAAKVRINP